MASYVWLGAAVLGACLWILLATDQLRASPLSPPIGPTVAGAVGMVVVLAAAAWDGWAIRRLRDAMRR